MEDLIEILVVLYVVLGVGFGGVALFNTIEDEELTRGRLVTIVVFLPQSIIVGIVFAIIALYVWVDTLTHKNHKLKEWWNSPIRNKR